MAAACSLVVRPRNRTVFLRASAPPRGWHRRCPVSYQASYANCMEEDTNMSMRVVRAMLIAPALLATLGGCVYRSVEKTTPSPVVMTPAPMPQPAAPPVVVAPPATVTAPASAADRVVYPQGRWQLFGDGRGTP